MITGNLAGAGNPAQGDRMSGRRRRTGGGTSGGGSGEGQFYRCRKRGAGDTQGSRPSSSRGWMEPNLEVELLAGGEGNAGSQAGDSERRIGNGHRVDFKSDIAGVLQGDRL